MMNKNIIGNTFLPLPEALHHLQIGSGELSSDWEPVYTADQVRAAILAELEARTPAAVKVDFVNYRTPIVYSNGTGTPAAPVVAEGLTPMDMWNIAAKECGTQLSTMKTDQIVLECPGDVRDLFNALLAAHPVATGNPVPTGSPAEHDGYTCAEIAQKFVDTVEENSRLKSGAAAPMPASEAQSQLGRMRSAFHINMLRAYPEKSHAEISAEIDKACGTIAQYEANAYSESVS